MRTFKIQFLNVEKINLSISEDTDSVSEKIFECIKIKLFVFSKAISIRLLGVLLNCFVRCENLVLFY